MQQSVSPLAESSDQAIFIPLLHFENDYEILNFYPFTIRNKSTMKELNGTVASDGYIVVKLNRKMYKQHRIIALQFIVNDDPALNDVIDHINHNRSDNHIENLRWTTQSINTKNKSIANGIVYDFVDTIPDDAIHVKDYGKHQFEDLYFFNNTFYFYNGMQYRVMHVSEKKRGQRCINFRDVDGKLVQIMYSKFKKLYDLID